MDHLIRKVATALLVTSCLSGCGSAELTRDKAASLIAARPEFAQPVENPKATAQAREQGWAQGFWSQQGEVTFKSDQYFYNWSGYGALRLRQPVKRTVLEITGIADALAPLGGQRTGSKEVQFRWEYIDVSDVVRRFVVKVAPVLRS